MKEIFDDPIPWVSVEDFPAISAETVFEKKCVPRVGKLKKKTQTQQKAARRQRATSLHEVKQEVNGVQKLGYQELLLSLLLK